MTHYLAFALGMFVTTLLFFAGYTIATRRDQRAQSAALTPHAAAKPDEMAGDDFAEWAGFFEHNNRKPQGASHGHE